MSTRHGDSRRPPKEETSLVQALLDSLDDAAAIVDADGTITATNLAWRRFCEERGGAHDGAGVGTDYLDVCRRSRESGEPSAAEALEAIAGVLDGTHPALHVDYGSGDVEEGPWFRLRAAALPGPDGGALLTHADISDRRHVEQAVRRREAEVNAIVQTAVDGIVTIDGRGSILSFNPAAERMFGYEEAELLGKNVKTIMPQPYRSEHDGYLERYVATGEAHIIGIGREVVGQRKDGTTLPLWLSVGEQSVEGERRFTGILHDLTAHKRDQERGVELARILEDSLNEIYVFKADDLRFVQVNQGARNNLGFSIEELKSMTPLDIKPDYTRSEFESLLQALRDSDEGKLAFETLHRRKDGSCYPVDVHLQRANLEGSPVYVAIILDITERKNHELQLERWNEELKERVAVRTQELEAAHAQLVRSERLATLGQLAGGVAHEVRNPLGVISNTVYYMRALLDGMTPDARECVEDIAREVATANRIVGELLDYARQPSPSRSRFDLCEMLATAVRAAQVPESIRVSLPEGADVTVEADSGQVERTLVNFIRNAVQAMGHAGGELRLRCGQDQGVAFAEVEDTGPGLSPDELGRVFEPLYTSKAKGIGLGLAVASRYAELNGGRVEAESQVGKGSVFRLVLPASETSERGTQEC